MANVKMEVFPEMANPGNCRNRIQETAEKPLVCPEENCTKPGVCRAIRKHWNSEHSVGKQVLSVKCAQDQCMWFCFHDTLKCFVFHMRSIHYINTNSDSEILFTVKIPKSNATHSQLVMLLQQKLMPKGRKSIEHTGSKCLRKSVKRS